MESKNLVLFLFLGVVAQGWAQVQLRGFNSYIPWKFGKCVVPPVVENFDPTKYFTGHWYEQASFGNFLFQASGICPTAEYKIDNGEIKELDYHFEQWLMQYITVSGSSYTQFIRDGKGYLPITYSMLGGLFQYEAPTYIVSTDYDTWALVYSCRQQLFLKAEMSWIVARNRTGWNITSEAWETVISAGLKPEDYIPATNVGCGPIEPHI